MKCRGADCGHGWKQNRDVRHVQGNRPLSRRLAAVAVSAIAAAERTRCGAPRRPWHYVRGGAARKASANGVGAAATGHNERLACRGRAGRGVNGDAPNWVGNGPPVQAATVPWRLQSGRRYREAMKLDFARRPNCAARKPERTSDAFNRSAGHDDTIAVVAGDDRPWRVRAVAQ